MPFQRKEMMGELLMFQLCDNDAEHGRAKHSISWVVGDPGFWADPENPPTMEQFLCKDCYDYATAPIEHCDYPCEDITCDGPGCTEEDRQYYKDWLATADEGQITFYRTIAPWLF